MNRIGAAFKIGADPTSWKKIDVLEANFPKTISQLKSAPNDQAADRIVLDLIRQVQNSQVGTRQEKEGLVSWLDGLRQVYDSADHSAFRPGKQVGSSEGKQEMYWPRDGNRPKTSLDRREK